MAKLTEAAYASIKGIKCPNCLSENVTGEDRPELDNGRAYQCCRCYDCGATWNDVYELIRYSGLEIPDKVNG